MNRITSKKNAKKFLYNYIGHGYVVLVLFFLIFLYFILTRTFFDAGLKKSDWLGRVNKSLGSTKEGKFLAKDKQGNFVVLDWEMVNPKDKSYFEATKKVSDLYCLSRIDVQLDFWRKHPEKCPELMKDFIKEDKNNINLDLVKEKACELGKLVFSPDDFSDKDEILFFVNSRDKKSDKLLGSVIFGIGGEYDYGDVFIRDIVSRPEDRDRGLGKLMASSILKIVPNLTQIKVYVLDTNKNGVIVYSSWDFYKQEIDSKNIKEGFILMGYDIEKSKLLQKVAANLKIDK
ncbi:MAG: hypothetical protein UR12_C0007G0033 [candidate division TM6 bacterium GW2011_GWF2_30_66]|jgi:hypothetical protein|nr:MAG: hypothetical protein UR12_C0007G0033 [candidate division TM6 bacterium GW2011_GWF2_30_66]